MKKLRCWVSNHGALNKGTFVNIEITFACVEWFGLRVFTDQASIAILGVWFVVAWD